MLATVVRSSSASYHQFLIQGFALPIKINTFVIHSNFPTTTSWEGRQAELSENAVDPCLLPEAPNSPVKAGQWLGRRLEPGRAEFES